MYKLLVSYCFRENYLSYFLYYRSMGACCLNSIPLKPYADSPSTWWYFTYNLITIGRLTIDIYLFENVNAYTYLTWAFRLGELKNMSAFINNVSAYYEISNATMYHCKDVESIVKCDGRTYWWRRWSSLLHKNWAQRSMVRDKPLFTYKSLSEVVLEKASSGTLCIELLPRYKFVRRFKLLNVLLCKNRNRLLLRSLQQKKRL